MSTPAKQRPPVPSVPPPDHEHRDSTGRYRIVQGQGVANATIVPPKGDIDAAEVSLEALGAVLELDAIDDSSETFAANDVRGSASGVFSASVRGDAAFTDSGLADLMSSIRPYYAPNRKPEERAELVIEDLSLRLDNPYAASSLVPPPRKALPVAKFASIVVAVLTVAGAAWFVWSGSSASVPAPSSQASQARERPDVPVQAAPVPAPEVQPYEAASSEPHKASGSVPVQSQSAATSGAAVVVARIRTTAASSQLHLAAALHEEFARPTAASKEPAMPVVMPASAPVIADSPAVVTDAVPAAASAASGPLSEQTVDAAHTIATPAVASGPLPETPSREQVAEGFERILDDITACAAGKHGIVTIEATITASGRLSAALIDGAFRGTAEGSCIARAARKASFPQFSQPTLKVSYPISL